MAKTAVVLCDSREYLSSNVLGLSIWQRLHLAMMHSGIEQVVYVGGAVLPAQKWLPTVSLESLSPDTRCWVVAANTVVNTKAFREVDERLPVKFMTAAEVAASKSKIDMPSGGRFGEKLAQLVTDKSSISTAAKLLKQDLRKPIDGLVSKHLNRHLSIATTTLLVKTKIRPNTFTVLFTFIGIAGAVCAAFGQPWWMLLLAGLFFQAQSVLDGCDGEIARLTYQFSPIGQWLDSIGDDITNYAFCFGLAVGIARGQATQDYIVYGSAVLLLQVLVSGLLYRRMLKLGTGDLLAIPDVVSSNPSGLVGELVYWLRIIMKRDFFVFVIAIMTAVGAPELAFWSFSGGTVLMAIGVFMNEFKLGQLERNLV